MPYALMDCGPGDLFIARNVGNLVPPWNMSAGFHRTANSIAAATRPPGGTVTEIDTSHWRTLPVPIAEQKNPAHGAGQRPTA